MLVVKKMLRILVLMGAVCTFISCSPENKKQITGSPDPSAISIAMETVSGQGENPSTICKKKNFKEVKLDLLTGYKDYYKCYVFNKKGEGIYSEILGPFVNPPEMTVTDNTVDIHFGAGTGTYLDKFIDYKNNRKSDWIENVRAIGKEQVAYVRWEDNSDGITDTLLIVAKKYEYNTEKKYVFPYVSDEWDIDQFEFRNDETNLYLHYIDKDTKKAAEKTIKLSEFQ